MTANQIQTILVNGIENADTIAIHLIDDTIRQYRTSDSKLKYYLNDELIKIEGLNFIEGKYIEYIDFKSIIRIKLYFHEVGGDAE